MRLVLISDTHARPLPAAVWDAIDRADLVVHAGDWVTVDLLDVLEARGAVVSCWGNNDGPDLRARLPEVARFTCEGLTFGVVHETGTSSGREKRMDRLYDDLDVLVFGHSHIPWDTVTPGGLRLLNPGSPTDRRTQPFATFMTADVSHGVVRDVTLHRLAP